MSQPAAIPPKIAQALLSNSPAAVLATTITHFGCQAGTVHRVQDGVLKLTASLNIPAQVLGLIESVPIGKGIAGLAAERREPVTLCNLQTDSSGQALPAAKNTGMEGSLAVPVLVNGQLRGVIGIAKASAYDWPPAETALLLLIASQLGECI